jgi:hypothetical protein
VQGLAEGFEPQVGIAGNGHQPGGKAYGSARDSRPGATGVKCEKCGVLNSADIEKCGNCGAALSGSQSLHAGVDGVVGPRTREDVAWESALATRASSSIWDDHRETTQTPSENSLLSMAVNIRRIFVVLLTFLAISTATMVATLYLAISDDPSINVVRFAIGASVLIAMAGGWYAVNSKRLSE